MTVGIDEVGRGAWAGPLVFAGVILPDYFSSIHILDDSKKLSHKKRLILSEEIMSKSKYYIAAIDNDEVDQLGLTSSSTKACLLILEALVVDLSCQIILDGNINFLKNTIYEGIVKNIIKADTTEPNVMAASIIAKVYRDNLMTEYSKEYMGYDFENNYGYGTKKHIRGLKKLGPCYMHRKSYKPIKNTFK